jgi:hypothetical protein
MSKGKLYEDIKTKFYKEFSGAGELWFNYFGSPEENAGHVDPHWDDVEIGSILDEAKKEFEQINPNYEDNTDWHDADLDEWFKKWFGDDIDE